MARRAGGVEVEVAARDARFQEAMRRTGAAFKRNEAAMRRQGKAARQLTKGFTVLRATIAGVAASAISGVSFGALLRSGQELRSEFGKLGATMVEIGRSVGITAQELQSIRRAFDANGVSAEKVDRALGRINRTFAEAKDLATYRRAFQYLGIDYERLAATAPTTVDLLNAVADGVKSTADRSKVASGLAQILGRDWQQISVVLEHGAEGLRRTREELDKFGLVSNEHFRVLKALEQATSNAAQAQTTELATATAQSAGSLDILNQALERSESFWKRWALTAADAIADVIRRATDIEATVDLLGHTELVTQRAQQQRLVAGLENQLAQATGRAAHLRDSIESKLREARARLVQLERDEQRRFGRRGPRPVEPVAETAAPPGGAPPAGLPGGVAAGYRRQVEAVIAARKQEVDAILESDRIIEESGMAMWRARAEAAVAEQERVFGAMNEAVLEANAAQEAAQQRLEAGAQRVAGGLAGALAGAATGVSSLSDGLKAFAAELAAAVLQAVLLRSILAATGGGGGFLGGALSFLGGGSLPGFAGGGRPPVGRPVRWQEQGGEIFVADRAGTIIPRDMAEAMAYGGGGVVVNVGGISVEQGPGESAQETAARLTGAVRRAVAEALRESGRASVARQSIRRVG